MHFETQKSVNLFETTIRVLGGILSAYDLSDENSMGNFLGVPNAVVPENRDTTELERMRIALLAKAEDVAHKLSKCFHT